MVKILTDSSADISNEYLLKHNCLDIIQIPLTHKERNISNIALDKFYNLLVTSDELPKTSQINPETYQEYFEKYKEDEIIYISLSSKLSGTFSSANLAKQLMEDSEDTSNIHLIDSNCATIQLGILVQIAVNETEKGKSAQEIVSILEDKKNKIKIRAIVDDLEFLHKGGRLSKTSAMIGNTLNIKPILEVKDGEIKVLAKIRGLKKVNKLLLEELNNSNISYKSLIYCSKWEDYENFKNQITTSFEECQIGSVIGTHVGPKCYGIAYLED